MSIKFPDFQVLVSRSDQIPRTNREGDPTGAAGKLAPQVNQQFAFLEQRFEEHSSTDRVRDMEENEVRRRGQQEKEEQKKKQNRSNGPGNRRRIDLRA